MVFIMRKDERLDSLQERADNRNNKGNITKSEGGTLANSTMEKAGTLRYHDEASNDWDNFLDAVCSILLTYYKSELEKQEKEEQ